MIETPLGQYINKDDILFFNIIVTGVNSTKGNKGSLVNLYAIEVRFKQGISLIISNNFESYELAKDALKKYMITI